MKYDIFRKYLASACLINLDLSKSPLITFNTLIDKVKEEDSWTKEDYSFRKKNCQHFIGKIVSILKPNYTPIGILPGENADLIEGKMIEEIIPSPILTELKKFEIKH